MLEGVIRFYAVTDRALMMTSNSRDAAAIPKVVRTGFRRLPRRASLVEALVYL